MTRVGTAVASLQRNLRNITLPQGACMNPPPVPLVPGHDAAALPQTETAQAVTVVPDPPKPPQIPRQQLGARIPADVYKRLRVRAVMEDVLIQELIERAIVEFLDRGELPCV